MSDSPGQSKTTILEGPDGRLYEIPDDTLATFAVSGARVMALRQGMSERASAASAAATPRSVPSGHIPPGHLPPGHAPAGHAAATASPSAMTIEPGPGGVVLNFYFGASTPVRLGAAPAPQADSEAGLQGYHMTFDESGIPTNHAEMLWGDYIDKQGTPAVGWHSHDPVTGNAQ